MAVLYVTELAALGRDARGAIMTAVADQPPAAEQTLTIGAGSVQSSAFNVLTKFVRIHADSVCSVAFGANPTATATCMRLAANVTEYFSVPLGASWKVAVITNT